jgi:hypothetical protein
MNSVHLTQYRSWRLPAVAALTALTLGMNGGHASEQDSQYTPTSPASLSSVNVSDLEDTFWICDWSATVSRLGAAQIAACASAAEELKARKFGGDFDKLIQWWQTNKTTVHERLNTTYVGALPR